MRAGTRLEIGFSNKQKTHNNDYVFKILPEIGEWTKMEISQTFENGGYVFRTKINGEPIDEREAPDAQEFPEMGIYAGSPWHDAMEGFVKDLYISASG